MIRLRKDNPYSTGRIVYLPNGQKLLQRTKIEYHPSTEDKLHYVTGNDNLSDLAYQYYGNSKYWWLIADVNSVILNPFILPVGKTIIIPDYNHVLAFSL